MKQSFFIILIFSCFPAFSQEAVSVEYANSITVDDLRTHLNVLASDALGGRETGESGQKMAAAYIGHFFRTTGLEPIVYTASGLSFFQQFELVSLKPGDAWIKINEDTYQNFKDIVYTGKSNFKAPVKSKLVFAGSGDGKVYETIEVTGKNVVIYSKGDRMDRNNKVRLALEKGAAQVFVIQEADEAAFKRSLSMYERYTSHGRLTFPPTEEETDEGYFMISKAIGAEILGISTDKLLEIVNNSDEGNIRGLQKLDSEEITFFARQEMESIQTENVLGFIEGTDKKDEYVIITAHFDHVGTSDGEVYNGADDDGSGTVAVMEIAEAFAKAKEEGHGPRRSMLFMTVTGEEKGLLGSTYYVNNPALPLEKTITNLNIDMIGRVDEVHQENPEYVYLIGSDKLSRGLHDLSEKVNATYSHLELDYKFNDDNDPNRFYYRSDHYNFAKNNIPIIFYFNGVHEDYHKSTDTVDKIEFEILEKRSRLIFHTAWEVANREEPISVDVLPNDLKIKNTN
jgi:hypothetical protein